MDIAEADAGRLGERLVAPLRPHLPLRPGASPAPDMMAELLSAMAVLDVASASI